MSTTTGIAVDQATTFSQQVAHKKKQKKQKVPSDAIHSSAQNDTSAPALTPARVEEIRSAKCFTPSESEKALLDHYFAPDGLACHFPLFCLWAVDLFSTIKDLDPSGMLEEEVNALCYQLLIALQNKFNSPSQNSNLITYLQEFLTSARPILIPPKEAPKTQRLLTPAARKRLQQLEEKPLQPIQERIDLGIKLLSCPQASLLLNHQNSFFELVAYLPPNPSPSPNPEKALDFVILFMEFLYSADHTLSKTCCLRMYDALYEFGVTKDKVAFKQQFASLFKELVDIKKPQLNPIKHVNEDIIATCVLDCFNVVEEYCIRASDSTYTTGLMRINRIRDILAYLYKVKPASFITNSVHPPLPPLPPLTEAQAAKLHAITAQLRNDIKMTLDSMQEALPPDLYKEIAEQEVGPGHPIEQAAPYLHNLVNDRVENWKLVRSNYSNLIAEFLISCDDKELLDFGMSWAHFFESLCIQEVREFWHYALLLEEMDEVIHLYCNPTAPVYTELDEAIVACVKMQGLQDVIAEIISIRQIVHTQVQTETTPQEEQNQPSIVETQPAPTIKLDKQTSAASSSTPTTTHSLPKKNPEVPVAQSKMQKALQNLKETFTQKTVRTPDAIDALKQVGVDEKSINGSHNNREGVGPNGQIIRTSIPVGGRNDYLTRYVLSKVRRALRNGGFL